MEELKADRVKLRALEPDDLQLLYRVENDPGVWEVSGTQAPFSHFVLKQYLEQAHRDIYEVKQLRLVICLEADGRPLGFIDLYEFDPSHSRAGVGILLFEARDRGQGYAYEALELLCEYAFTHLRLHQLYAGITTDNKPSITLFEKAGFELTGKRLDWIQTAQGYKTELFYQKFADVH